MDAKRLFLFSRVDLFCVAVREITLLRLDLGMAGGSSEALKGMGRVVLLAGDGYAETFFSSREHELAALGMVTREEFKFEPRYQNHDLRALSKAFGVPLFCPQERQVLQAGRYSQCRG